MLKFMLMTSLIMTAYICLTTQLPNFIVDVRGDEELSSCTYLRNLVVMMDRTDRHTHYDLVYRLIRLALISPMAAT